MVKGHRCLALTKSLEPLSSRSACFQKQPLSPQLLSLLNGIRDDFESVLEGCEDRHRTTWVEFMERMNQTCELFEARSTFKDVLKLREMPQRLARAAIQCLADSPAAREGVRGGLTSFTKTIMASTTPQTAKPIRRVLLRSMLDSFPFVGAGLGAPAISRDSIAAAIAADSSVSTDEWFRFLSLLSAQFPANRARLIPQVEDVPTIARQLKLAEELLPGA